MSGQCARATRLPSKLCIKPQTFWCQRGSGSVWAPPHNWVGVPYALPSLSPCLFHPNIQSGGSGITSFILLTQVGIFDLPSDVFVLGRCLFLGPTWVDRFECGFWLLVAEMLVYTWVCDWEERHLVEIFKLPYLLEPTEAKGSGLGAGLKECGRGGCRLGVCP